MKLSIILSSPFLIASWLAIGAGKLLWKMVGTIRSMLVFWIKKYQGDETPP